MAAGYDLIVMGGGPAGCTAALRGASLGLKTLLVEKDDRLGGCRGLRGDVPTRALIRAAASRHSCRRSPSISRSEHPFTAETWNALRREVDRTAAEASRRLAASLDQAAVQVVRGVGRLDGPGRVRVDGQEVFTADRIILATGAAPVIPRWLEGTPPRVLPADNLLDGPELPDSLVVLGAGPRGVELALVTRQLGCRTTLVEAEGQVLPAADPDGAAVMAAALTGLGVEVLTGWKAKAASCGETEVTLRLQEARDRSTYRDCRAGGLLVAAGRRPAIRDLGLDTVHVITDRRGFVQTDAMMRTPTPGLYAVGDMVATPLSGAAARAEARVAAEHAAGRGPEPVPYTAVPVCSRGVAATVTVGLREDQALAAGHLVTVGRGVIGTAGAAAWPELPCGGLKVVVDREDDRVLGVHMAGRGVEPLAAEAAAAVAGRQTAADWARTLRPFSGAGDALDEALQDVQKQHGIPARREPLP